MPLSLLQAAQMLGGSNDIWLFEIDLGPVNGPVLFLHNAIAKGAQTIQWQGEEYAPFPIEVEGLEANLNDQYPQPKLRVDNLDGIVYSLCRNYRDLLGAVVRVHHTLFFTNDAGQIVDADGAPVLVAPGPNDPLPSYQEWLHEFEINQRSNDTGVQIEFTLRAGVDTARKVPASYVSAHYCQWLYRGGGCPYAAKQLFDRLNNPIPWTTNRGTFDLTATYVAGDLVYLLNRGVRSYYVAQGASAGTYPALAPDLWKRDTCSKTAANKKVTGCSCRFGLEAVLPADIYPATARLSA